MKIEINRPGTATVKTHRLMRILIYIVFLTFIDFTATAQLVLPGDYPDPSVTKVGDTYWATATTSNWAPVYPLLQSKDLMHWETKGYVFNELPSWADYYFWAPEISYEKGKVYVYYSAHKKNGNLCLGIASADNPLGPYTDHGPMMCQEVGSIDAFPMRDKNGKLYMIWKEDGNSVKKPTPIWAMEMNEERTALVGEKKELFRNDQPWEKHLVEGVSMIRHGKYFYAFYSVAGCCGKECNYTTGVARAEDLLGPWEKYNKNPILTDDREWKCPGHGTSVEKDGKYYFLYHAYNKKSDVYTGRQGLLKEFRFTSDGWIEFLPAEKGDVSVPKRINDDFTTQHLSKNWQWSVFQNIKYHQRNGDLELDALPSPSGALLAQKSLTDNYTVSTVFAIDKSTAEGGIAAIGDEKNMVSLSYRGGTLSLWVVQGEQQKQLFTKPVTGTQKLFLEMRVRNGKDITFRYSTDGKSFITMNDKPLDSSFLPPWDRSIRVGLVSKGNEGDKATFESFTIINEK